MTRAVAAAAAAAVAIAAVAGGAAAEPGPPGLTAPVEPDPPGPRARDARPRTMLAVGGLIRATGRDPEGAAELDALRAYGWDAWPAALVGLRGEVAWTEPPIVDLGVALAWGRGTFATGPAIDDPDRLVGSALEAGVFARLHWVPPRSPVAAEPRVEAGLTRTSIDLRGATASRLGAYTRVGLDLRAGTPAVGVLVGLDYTRVHDGGDAMVDVPTGGITVALSVYWRQFRR